MLADIEASAQSIHGASACVLSVRTAMTATDTTQSVSVQGASAQIDLQRRGNGTPTQSRADYDDETNCAAGRSVCISQRSSTSRNPNCELLRVAGARAHNEASTTSRPIRTMAFQKNNAQAAKLAALSKELGMPVRAIMLSDEHIDAVCPIFYEGLPKIARMTMNREKFRAFYINQRLKLADEMFPENQ